VKYFAYKSDAEGRYSRSIITSTAEFCTARGVGPINKKNPKSSLKQVRTNINQIRITKMNGKDIKNVFGSRNLRIYNNIYNTTQQIA